MNAGYYKGSFADDMRDEDHKGWLIGHFMDAGPRQTSDFEVKYWEFPEGPTTHKTKYQDVIEATFILQGKVRGIIDGQDITLQAGDYIVIKPGIISNIVIEILEAASGLTIKSPSQAGSKHELESEANGK